jgi:excisionase family DNA binding protein
MGLRVSDDRSSVDVRAELGILEAHEVAELLKLRHSTVLDLSRRGIVPAFKIGKHWRYRRADLEAWMTSRREAA